MIGLGVLGMDDAQVRDAVPAALGSGYRLVDTASRYYNEKAVGAALADAAVPAPLLGSIPAAGRVVL